MMGIFDKTISKIIPKPWEPDETDVAIMQIIYGHDDFVSYGTIAGPLKEKCFFDDWSVTILWSDSLYSRLERLWEYKYVRRIKGKNDIGYLYRLDRIGIGHVRRLSNEHMDQ